MKASSTRHVAVLAAALLGALAPSPASAVLERVGPNSPTHFQPEWYQDSTGLAFEFCTPLNDAEYAGGWCLLAPTAGNVPGNIPGDVTPEVFPDVFSGEHFYWAADVTGNWSYVPTPANPNPPFFSGKVVLVDALESAYLGTIGPGLGIVFGRVRIRMLDLPLTGTYKFYTPWGIKLIDGTAGGRIFDSEDIGINCAAFTYDCALQTSIGPFLVPSATPGGAELPPVAGPVPGKLYLSDPASPPGPVTGSPIQGNYTLSNGQQVNPNVFAIEAPDGQLIFLSHDFATMGRLHTDVIPSRITADRGTYARDAGGAIRVDGFATGEPTVHPRLTGAAPTAATQPVLNLFSAPCAGTTGPNGDLLPPYSAPAGATSTPMARNGNLYWASAASALIPAGVCIQDANAVDAGGNVLPTYVLGSLTDQVFVTAAVFDPTNGGSLSVRASSSDEAAPPILSLGAFGDLAANVPLDNNLAYVAPLAAPPSRVRVYSQEGGSAELLVKVGSRVATGVTLTADLSSPQVTGTAVVFTAQGEGALEYLYRFWLDTGSGFGTTPVQDWSTKSTWALPGTLPPGQYRVIADVWAGLQPTAPDATSNLVVFDITAPPATGILLTADRSSPALINTTPAPTIFTAAGVGSTAAYDYRFFLSTNGGAFVLVQDWGLGATWTMPASTPAGNYEVQADVRTAVAVDATNTRSFVLQDAPAATGVTLTANQTSPKQPGTNVTFTAAGSGSSGYSYRFLLSTDGGAFVEVQPFSANSSWTLSNPGEAAYVVQAEVKAAPASLVADASTTMPFVVRANPAATGVALTADRTSPALVNIVPLPTVFTATGTGTLGGYDYRFWLSANGGPYVMVQDYGGGAAWTMPASTPIGAYNVRVDVRTSVAVSLDATNSIAFDLVAPAPATGVLLTSSLASPQGAGTPVLFTAQGQGGVDYQYRFWLKTNGVWSVVQDWATTATWLLPTTTVAGDYVVQADVRTSQTRTRDAARTVGYTLLVNMPATGVTLTPSLPSPVVAGTTVNFNAAGIGGTGTYQYRFSLKAGTGAMTEVQAYGPSATWTLPASTPENSYTVQVEVRTNTNVARDAVTTVAYVVRAYTAATAVTVTASPAGAAPVGTPVLFTAVGSGSNAPPGAYQYRFWLKVAGAWTIMQDYGVGSTWTLPTNLLAGTYSIQVDARTSATVSRDVAKSFGYVLQ